MNEPPAHSGPSTTERGRRGEEIAAQALRAHGYEIIAQNWRSPAGEIDIVAREGETLAFVEVKTRQGEAFGAPEDSVNEAKQVRLIQAAQVYLADSGQDDVDWRIDVVAIELAADGRVFRLTLYRDAVRADD